MKQLLREFFQDSDGSGSSKRVVLFILLLTFVGIVIYNTHTGKNPDATLRDQLFYAMMYCLTLIFGEKVLKIKKPDSKVQETQTDSSTQK